MTMTDHNNDVLRIRLNELCEMFPGSYYQKISDPVQTHAVYGVAKSDKEYVVKSLKYIGAKRFRIVQAGIKGLIIVCFSIK
jgi:hypothetical protein